MALKTVRIALFQSCLLSAAAMGAQKNVEVGAHDPVDVPERYARDLIENRFAYLYDDDREGESKSTKKAIAAAEKAVISAKAALDGVDEAGRPGAEAALAEAEASLAKLKV